MKGMSPEEQGYFTKLLDFFIGTPASGNWLNNTMAAYGACVSTIGDWMPFTDSVTKYGDSIMDKYLERNATEKMVDAIEGTRADLNKITERMKNATTPAEKQKAQRAYNEASSAYSSMAESQAILGNANRTGEIMGSLAGIAGAGAGIVLAPAAVPMAVTGTVAGGLGLIAGTTAGIVGAGLGAVTAGMHTIDTFRDKSDLAHARKKVGQIQAGFQASAFLYSPGIGASEENTKALLRGGEVLMNLHDRIGTILGVYDTIFDADPNSDGYKELQRALERADRVTETEIGTAVVAEAAGEAANKIRSFRIIRPKHSHS